MEVAADRPEAMLAYHWLFFALADHPKVTLAQTSKTATTPTDHPEVTLVEVRYCPFHSLPNFLSPILDYFLCHTLLSLYL